MEKKDEEEGILNMLWEEVLCEEEVVGVTVHKGLHMFHYYSSIIRKKISMYLIVSYVHDKICNVVLQNWC